MKIHTVLFAILIIGFLAPCQAAASTLAELQMRNKNIVLSETSQQELRQEAVQLVETSNFHSNPGDNYHFFKLSDVQRDYRREVAGKFLLIAFSKPQKIKTIGGAISVVEIVIGLNRDDYASSLFTIDDSGRIIGHSKYAGERCIHLPTAIKRLAP